MPIFYHDSEESESSSSTNTSKRQHWFPSRTQFNDFKVDIPKFEGRLEPNEFVDWLHIVEQVFELKEILNDQRVKIIAIKLKKHASIWWENLKQKR